MPGQQLKPITKMGGEKAQKKGKKREGERTKRKERRKIPCLDSFGRDLEVEIVKKSL
jgi:hypothetical protein